MNPKAIQVSRTKSGHRLFPQVGSFMGVIKDAWSVTRNNSGCGKYLLSCGRGNGMPVGDKGSVIERMKDVFRLGSRLLSKQSS